MVRDVRMSFRVLVLDYTALLRQGTRGDEQCVTDTSSYNYSTFITDYFEFGHSVNTYI